MHHVVKIVGDSGPNKPAWPVWRALTQSSNAAYWKLMVVRPGKGSGISSYKSLITKRCQGYNRPYQARPPQARPNPLGLVCTACWDHWLVICVNFSAKTALPYYIRSKLPPSLIQKPDSTTCPTVTRLQSLSHLHQRDITFWHEPNNNPAG